MSDNTPAPHSQIDIFPAADGNIRVEVRFLDDTAWLSQKLMAELFQVSVPTVNEHLKNIFADGELAEGAVVRNFRITASDGKEYLTKHYSLDAIIAVGYRVRSSVAPSPTSKPSSMPTGSTRPLTRPQAAGVGRGGSRSRAGR